MFDPSANRQADKTANKNVRLNRNLFYSLGVLSDLAVEFVSCLSV